MAIRKKSDAEGVSDVSNVAEDIWEKVKGLKLDLFALPNQTLEKHAVRNEQLEIAIPDTLHLTLKSSAVLPAIEEGLKNISPGEGKVFVVSKSGSYVTIKINNQ